MAGAENAIDRLALDRMGGSVAALDFLTAGLHARATWRMRNRAS